MSRPFSSQGIKFFRDHVLELQRTNARISDKTIYDFKKFTGLEKDEGLERRLQVARADSECWNLLHQLMAMVKEGKAKGQKAIESRSRKSAKTGVKVKRKMHKAIQVKPVEALFAKDMDPPDTKIILQKLVKCELGVADIMNECTKMKTIRFLKDNVLTHVRFTSGPDHTYTLPSDDKDAEAVDANYWNAVTWENMCLLLPHYTDEAYITTIAECSGIKGAKWAAKGEKPFLAMERSEYKTQVDYDQDIKKNRRSLPTSFQNYLASIELHRNIHNGASKDGEEDAVNSIKINEHHALALVSPGASARGTSAYFYEANVTSVEDFSAIVKDGRTFRASLLDVRGCSADLLDSTSKIFAMVGSIRAIGDPKGFTTLVLFCHSGMS